MEMTCDMQVFSCTLSMAIRVVEFSSGGYKIAKNQHTQRELLNFEFWINGELSKIEHHASNKGKYSKIDFIKKCAPKLVFFYKKNEKDLDDF